MEIIDVDWQVVTDHLWATSEHIKEYELKKQDLMLEELEVCRLDPGGMLNTKEPWKQFKIDKYAFEIQLSKIDWVISRVRTAKERIPKCRRIGMWMWNIILSDKLHGKLLDKLVELSSNDETLHARLDDFELKEKLEAGGYIVFPDIPREPDGNQ